MFGGSLELGSNSSSGLAGQIPLYLRFVTVHGFKEKFSVAQKLKIAIAGNNNNR